MKMKQFLFGLGAGAGMIGSIVSPVLAAPVSMNGSFEDGVDPGLFLTVNTGGTAIEDWDVVSGSVDYIGSYWTASEGDRSIDMSGNEAGTISQTVPTIANAVYTVKFDLSGNPDGGPTEKSLDVSAGATTENFTYDTVAEGTTKADMQWLTQSLMFTATGAETLVTFASMTPGFFGPALDNVQVEQYLPESKDDCKKNGWRDFGVFKNQGDCVSYVATGGNNPPANQ